MKLFGTLTLASLATAQWGPKMDKELPTDKELIGGFNDEPIAFPAMGKGPIPGFMNKAPIDQGDMPMNPLEAVKSQIAVISDIDGVKGVLDAIIEMMIAKMEQISEKPPMGEKPSKGNGSKGKGSKGKGNAGKAGNKGGNKGAKAAGNNKKQTAKKPVNKAKKPSAKKNRKG